MVCGHRGIELGVGASRPRPPKRTCEEPVLLEHGAGLFANRSARLPFGGQPEHVTRAAIVALRRPGNQDARKQVALRAFSSTAQRGTWRKAAGRLSRKVELQ